MFDKIMNTPGSKYTMSETNENLHESAIVVTINKLYKYFLSPS